MDYDGANQHAVTHLGTISLSSPRVSPDNSRLAFQVQTAKPVGTSRCTRSNWDAL
jgi:hypothetical protein